MATPTQQEHKPKSRQAAPEAAREPALLAVSQLAAGKIMEFMAKGRTDRLVRLRLSPEAELRSKYELEFIDLGDVHSADVLVESRGLTFVLDQRSARLAQGISVEWVEGMWRSGFRFENPNRLDMMADARAFHVQRVLDQRVAPALQEHGGKVTLVDVRGGLVYLEFGGACQGCGAAPSTVRSVVERALCEELPEIGRVVDVTDHPAGENPYQ